MPVAAVEIRLVVDQSPGVVVGAVTMVAISKVKILIVVADNQITIAVDDVEKLKVNNNSLFFWKWKIFLLCQLMRFTNSNKKINKNEIKTHWIVRLE